MIAVADPNESAEDVTSARIVGSPLVCRRALCHCFLSEGSMTAALNSITVGHGEMS